MITRSMYAAIVNKERESANQQTTMANNNDVAQKVVAATNDSIDSFEVNNQLGIEGIFDDIPPIDASNSRTGARGRSGRSQEEEQEIQQRNPEASETGARGPEQSAPQMSELERILMLLQNITEENQKTREDNRITREENRAAIQEIKAAIREEIKELREENARMHQETRDGMRRTEKELRAEMHEMRKEFNTEVCELKEESEKTRTEVRENCEAVAKIKSDIANNHQKLITKTHNLSENLNRINTELRSEMRVNKEETVKVSKHQEELEEEVKRLSEEKKKRIDEVREEQEQLKRRIIEFEGRPTSRNITSESYKEVTFNGVENYPMEFLNELREIKEIFHQTEDTKWIGRHLVEEAMVWWRIVRNKINNFAEFEERFMEKYWGPHVQEGIRDRLEYGRYRPNGKMRMVQYMETQILQCRQLIPPISDAHMIKKLARHYTRDVEIAVLTRGIREIPQFEALLQEYAKINGNCYERARPSVNNSNYSAVKKEESVGEQKEKKTFHTKTPYHKNLPKQHVDLNTVTAGPSGVSKQTKNGITNTRPE